VDIHIPYANLIKCCFRQRCALYIGAPDGGTFLAL
jgi:hypothetical protein